MEKSKEFEKIAQQKVLWESKNFRNNPSKSADERWESDGSEVELLRLYSPDNLKLDYLRDLNFPGEFPYTRGVQPDMYRGRLWTMRQYAGYGTAQETNSRFQYLLKQGQTGLSVAFDLVTQIGYNSDDPLAQGEVGKVGVAIDSLADIESLFKDIPLDKVSTSMTINAPAAILLAMYIVVAEKQGIASTKLSGTIQNDILKEYMARGTYIFPPKPSMRLITDTFKYCAEHLPNWNTISISGYHIREAGSNAIQEVAFTLADGIAYVEAALNAGLEIDQFAPRLSFFFNAHSNFLEEIAKFRAARRVWAKIMKNRFKADNPKSLMMRFHTQTAGCTLTAQQPEVNIMRVAFQALSAVLGGTQSLHTNAWDEALALPSQESALLALRTQQTIAYETGVTETVDPLGGSYCVEKLTEDIEKAVWGYLEKIDELGGAVRAIELGFQQKEIQTSAYRYQMEIENQKRIIVGINKFEIKQDPPQGLLKVNPKVEQEQKQRLAAVYRKRNQAEVENSLIRLEKAAKSTENLMPFFLDCVRNYTTLGEICDVLRQVFGEYRQDNTF
ncbi:methylmalonyl-CoA mutase family protein [Desulfosporosinus orientis DSM 765]|uniref:Methylmalonyl-CoA mutase family protein n=1 Tax=Desulfosporosinus orientis (strain ATCC 19365 / DSM 765 / NCIMB 8382 / VKM B-1628 / Singapore I) TaxID=768706 RepID=G7WIA6_DESOD|nr:methylmalonyl-CoA mutase family protein [Desulfosporosinus orientis]AET68554.1 methylmalonyl-CoA mutase family protein [Desulfosporosinus orientis DSM 765]